MQFQVRPDDLCWEQAEEISDLWLLQFLELDILRPIADFILKHNRGIATEFAILRKGSYNISLRLKYGNEATVIRLSQPGAVMFPEEKVENEFVVMRFLADQTSIPLPFILHSGPKKESPLELSPFIIMDYIEHETKMYDALNTPGCPKEERGVLNPEIDEGRLEMLYSQLAEVLLRLSIPCFPRIESLSQIDDFTWDVTRRPLSMNMNEMVRLGGLPRSKLPDIPTTFDTASSYIKTLADLNMHHLIHQGNDCVESADDCRRKYVARHLFRKLAKERRLAQLSLDKGPFKLWCEDLRPANILLNEESQIAGVVDWGFTYAAPVEFSNAPPWWLLIEKPDHWPKGLDDWTRQLDARLTTFLKAMKSHEYKAIQQGRIQEDQRLSGPMRESWESGDFWIIYAVLHSFAFDAIYWQKIDWRFFGHTENIEQAWRERLSLMDEREKDEMEVLVARKVEEMKTRVLSWDPDEYTLTFRQELKSREEAEGDLNKLKDSNETKTY